MLRPKSVVRQSRVTAVIAPFAFALCMGISHQALAAPCTEIDTTGNGPVVFSCNGEDQQIPVVAGGLDVNFVTAAPINMIVEVTGSPEEETAITNDQELEGSIVGTVSGDPTSLSAARSAQELHGIRAVSVENVSEVESFEFTNLEDGEIELTHNGTGLLAGVTAFAGAGEEMFLVENEGKISVTRGPQTLGAYSPTATTSVPTGSGLSSATLNIAAGIYIHEEETGKGRIVNEEEGVIEAHGPLAFGLYVRPTALELVNEGLITVFNNPNYADPSNPSSTATGTYSAAIVTWDGRLNQDNASSNPTERTTTYGKTFIDNFGVIQGDVFVIDANREFARRTTGTNFDTDVAALDIVRAVENGSDPFTTQNDTIAMERRDSEINNFETIIGNIYLFSGSHTLSNADGAEIEGDVVVDQRRRVNYAAVPGTVEDFRVGVASRFTAAGDDDDDDDDGGDDDDAPLSNKYYGSYAELVEENPDHHLTFDNAGVLDGDLIVMTYQGSVTGNFNSKSSVEIIEHIKAPGSFDRENPIVTSSGYIDGKLAVGKGKWDGGEPEVEAADTEVDDVVTITPVLDHYVRNGEWFAVAKELVGEDVPEVEGTALVSWEAWKNTAGPMVGSLVIGATVANASTIDGLSAPGVATINALMQGGNAGTNGLAAAVQSLTDEDDVRKAGEQLKPETNFATQQAAWTLSFLTGNSIDNRLNGVGATGAGPGLAQAAGLGMTQTASASPAPEGRMSLGLGTNDGRMNIGANDGRMDAGIYEDADPGLRQRAYNSGIWGQVFGAGLSQDERANVAGYDTNIYGAMAGVDNWIDARTRLGFAGGYGNTSIDTENPDTKKNQTEIDSYLGMIYGAYKGSGWYLSTRAGYSWHDYTTQRVVTVPVNATALGSHSGNQYTASAEIGSPLHYYGGAFTPVASVTWNRLEQDGYQESSVVGLNVASQENDSLQSGLGAKTMIQVAPGTLIEGRAIWYHEFEDTNQQVTAAFGGAANFTAAGPSVGRDTAAVGVGMFAYSEAGVSVQLNYDALLRQDFIGHTGSGRVKVEF